MSVSSQADPVLADRAEVADWWGFDAAFASADVNETQADGVSALAWAAFHDNVEAAERLIQAGAFVDASSRNGVTPLILAVDNGSERMVQLLLEAGADANRERLMGETPLMRAARVGNPALLTLLLNHGARVNAAEQWHGQTALMWAAGEDNADAVRVLIEQGADIDAVSSEVDWGDVPGGGVTSALPVGGLTALFHAARENALDAARVLLEFGADPNIKDPQGLSPVRTAIMNGHLDLAKLILDHGGDPAEGALADAVRVATTPMMRAATNHVEQTTPLEMIELLLDYGAPVDSVAEAVFPKKDAFSGSAGVRERPNQTPLYYAAGSRDMELARFFIDRGADVNYGNGQDNSRVLTLAFNVRDAALAEVYVPSEAEIQSILALGEYLLAAGADINARNDQGSTVLHEVAARGIVPLARFLVANGARMDIKDNFNRTPLDRAKGVDEPLGPGEEPPMYPLEARPEMVDFLAGSMRAEGIPIEDYVPPSPDTANAGTQEGVTLDEMVSSLDGQFGLVYDYCVGCHNESDYAGGLSLEYAFASAVPENPETWEKVIRKLKAGQMPPRDAPAHPQSAAVEDFLATLETTLDLVAAANPNPGATVLHRLNRTEYGNAIRDLLGLEIDVRTMLLSDDSAEGFDNMAHVLTISPALMAGYLAASGQVASLAVGDMDMVPEVAIYRAAPDLSQDSHIPGAPLGTQGGLVFEHYFPLDGLYEFEPMLYRGILAMVKGVEYENTLQVTIDKELVHEVTFGGLEDKLASHENAHAHADALDARLAFRTPVTAGPHTVAINFVAKPRAQSAEIWQQFQRTAIDSNEDKGVPHLDKVEITGPYNPTGRGDTPSRERIFTCKPGVLDNEQRACAAEILSQIASRAYRRNVTETEVAGLMTFYDESIDFGESFEKAIETGIRRIISGPEFIFRAEPPPEGVAPGSPYRISDLQLASRLSFFLWSSIPDQELLDTALRGDLSKPDVLEAQVERMLADPKSISLTNNFATQWLALRNLESIVPDPGLFPDFDDNLRQAFLQETRMLFESIVREDRNVMDLFTADYTYVNERLAEHYGIPGVYGTRFRRVDVENEARQGILGHGSVLTLTSLSTRTSAVTRGKWVLENLIGTPPPAPPPNIPALEESAGEEPSTLREQLARHRADPVCASCHDVMDPIGFAFENFDAVGRWRHRDAGLVIDATDTMYDGTEITGVPGLRGFLLSREDMVLQTFVEKMLTFALGRPLEYYDMPTVREITRLAQANDNRFGTIVEGIVSSMPFQMRMSQPADEGLASVR